jgi:uncharacterized Fe-S cluster-containing radical SAM superfamily enzyme
LLTAGDISIDCNLQEKQGRKLQKQIDDTVNTIINNKQRNNIQRDMAAFHSEESSGNCDPVVKTRTRIYLEESVNPSLCTIFSDSFSICPKDSGKKRLARTSNESLQYVARLSAL